VSQICRPAFRTTNDRWHDPCHAATRLSLVSARDRGFRSAPPAGYSTCVAPRRPFGQFEPARSVPQTGKLRSRGRSGTDNGLKNDPVIGLLPDRGLSPSEHHEQCQLELVQQNPLKAARRDRETNNLNRAWHLFAMRTSAAQAGAFARFGTSVSGTQHGRTSHSGSAGRPCSSDAL
jgi:hypothetical protein